MATKEEKKKQVEELDPEEAKQKATRKLRAAKGLVTKGIIHLQAAMDNDPRELQHRAYAESLLEQVDRGSDDALDRFEQLEDLIELDVESAVIEREQEEIMMRIV